MDSSAPDGRRYGRQIVLPSFGIEGQQRLAAASVLVVGAGGLGSPALLYLAAAGVGRLTIIDGDRVELSNLHRQVLHTTDSVGELKIDSAARTIGALNPGVEIRTIPQMIDADNARAIIAGHDLVIDGSDNFTTRYLVNDAAWFERVPVVYGSVFRFEGQVSLFDPPAGPCYRCLYPVPPPDALIPNCEEGGVLGVVPGLVGMLQATEAIKRLTGIGRSMSGRLLLVDLAAVMFRELAVPRRPDCPLCSDLATIRSVETTVVNCETGDSSMNEDITPEELHRRIQGGDTPRLIDVREQWEWDQAHLEGAEHIPMRQLENSLARLDPHQEIVLYCRSGARSGRAAAWLRGQGFENVRNLEGGILRWSSAVDPSIPRY